MLQIAAPAAFQVAEPPLQRGRTAGFIQNLTVAFTGKRERADNYLLMPGDDSNFQIRDRCKEEAPMETAL